MSKSQRAAFVLGKWNPDRYLYRQAGSCRWLSLKKKNTESKKAKLELGWTYRVWAGNEPGKCLKSKREACGRGRTDNWGGGRWEQVCRGVGRSGGVRKKESLRESSGWTEKTTAKQPEVLLLFLLLPVLQWQVTPLIMRTTMQKTSVSVVITYKFSSSL